MKLMSIINRLFLVLALLGLLLPTARVAEAVPSAVDTVVLSENFDAVTPPALPEGWATAVVGSATTEPMWGTSVGGHDPDYLPAYSDPNVVYFNSASSNESARLYHTGLNLSAAASASLSFWMFHDNFMSGSQDRVQPQVSTNGVDWVNMGDPIYRYSASQAWRQYTVDISAYTGPGMTDVRVGLLGIAEFGKDCHIDDIAVTSVPLEAPVVTTHPQSQSVTESVDAVFTAEASGAPNPTMRWQQSDDSGATWDDLSDGGSVSGATTGQLTLSAVTLGMSGYQYRAVFTNVAAPSGVASNAATLTVTAAIAPVVTAHPASRSVLEGRNAVFTATANGDPTPTVQWQWSDDSGATWVDLSDGGSVSGATTGQLTLSAVTLGMSGYQYRAVFTNVAAPSGVASNAATLTVAPVLLSESFDGVAAPGLPAGWATVAVSGSVGQWRTATGASHPTWGVTVHSAPNLVYFNSWDAKDISARLYRTTGVDLSGAPSAALSFWMYHDSEYDAGPDRVQAQVSVDAGATWVNVGSAVYRYSGYEGGFVGWREHTVDLSAYVGEGKINVMVGLLGISGWGNNCHLDDITLSVVSPAPVAYTVTYDPNGGSGPAPTETPKDAGATFAAASNTFTPPAGKQFKEWNASADGNGTSYTAGATVTMPASNLTLYAIWQDIPVPDLTIAKTHAGDFTQGQTGAQYTITVTNASATAATDGTVTVADTLPTGLTATSISGDGWTCDPGALTCNRSDALAALASYPAITLVVNVATDAPASVTNTATVSGGGEIDTTNNEATDPTTVNPLVVSIKYVDDTAAGANNGTSWADAYTSLQSALSAAVAGDEIWVAAGVYKPSVPLSGYAGQRYFTFTMKEGVAVYGGFPEPSLGFDPDMDDRDWEANVTTLSGDLNGNGQDDADAYHVVVTDPNLSSAAILDGFTITGGRANGSPTNPRGWGGGMWLHQGSPTLANLRFVGNLAGNGGGAGLYVASCDDQDQNCVQTSPTISNVVFEGNSVPEPSTSVGGGMGIDGGGASPSMTAPNLTNVTFIDNNAYSGGGLAVADATTSMTGLTFIGNTARNRGGGLWHGDWKGGTVSVADAVFSGNSALGCGGGADNSGGTLNLANVAFLNNSAPRGGGLSDFATSRLVNVVFSGNTATTEGGVIWGQSSNSTLTNVTFTGSDAPLGAVAYAAWNSAITIKNSIAYGNTGEYQFFRHWDGAQIAISNSLIEGGCPAADATCSAVIAGDPLFANAADPDGTDDTFGNPDDGLLITGGSPAIDAGDNSFVPADITTDLAGQTRFKDDSGTPDTGPGAPPIVDLGAYEFQGTSDSNTAPVVSADSDATIDEGGTFSQSGSFTDPNADSWTGTVDYGDGGGEQSLTLTDKTFSLSHTYADNGSYTVTVTVDDGTATGEDTVTVTVNNVAPSVSAGPDANIDAGGVFTQTGSFTDPGADGWVATVNYGEPGGTNEALTLTGKDFSLSHTYAAAGVYTVTVTVTETDPEAASGQDTVTVTVSAVNTAPVVDAGVDATIDEGGVFSQSGSFTDPDADAWSATVDYGDGSGEQSLALSGKDFNLSHTYADNGSYTVTVSVSDGKATDEDTVTVTVNNVAPSVNAGPDANIDAGGTFSQSGSFTDPGDDTWEATVNYGETGGVAQPLTLNDNTFSLSHTYDTVGVYTVTVTVTDDDEGSDSDTVQVTVSAVNTPPVPNAGGPYSVNEGGSITLSGSATDEGGALTYAWDLDNNGTFETVGQNPTFSAASLDGPSVAPAVLRVCDSEPLCGVITATVTINNVAPTATFNKPASVNEGSDITLSLTAPSDPSSADTTAGFTYAFDCGSGYGSPGATSSATCPSDVDGSLDVKGKIIDKDGGYSEYTSTVTINNVAPVVEAGANAAIDAGATFSQAGSFTHPGPDICHATVDYGDGLGEQPLTLTGQTFGLSCAYAIPGLYTIEVTVFDDDGGSGSDTVQVTVNAVNTAPVVDAGSDATINEGAIFSQSGSFIDPDDDSWEATVDYGDGSGEQSLALSGKYFNLSHTYADNGSYTVTVSVDDGKATDEDTVTVTVNNVVPAVNAGADATINAGATFSQSGSFTDPGADSWTATVNYGEPGGANETLALTGKDFSLSHTYASAGVYTATVVVTETDPEAASGQDTVQVTVNAVNTAPVPNAGGPYSVAEGGSVGLSGSAADEGGDLVYAWDLDNDGAFDDSTDQNPTFSAAALDGPDSQTVGLRVCDSEPLCGVVTTTVTINNVEPVVDAGGDRTILEGDTFSQPGSFTDPAPDNWSATVNYGDGSGEQTLALVGKDFSLSHVYTVNGVYTVTVTVTDDDGGTDTDTIEVTVAATPPAGVVITGPTSGVAGVPYQFTAQVSPITVTTPITYSWTATDFPDPIVHSGGISDTVEYTWTQPGAKTVSVSVQNEGDEFLVSDQARIAQSLVYTSSVVIDIQAPIPPEIPEPGSMLLLASGLAGLGGLTGLRSLVRRRARK